MVGVRLFPRVSPRVRNIRVHGSRSEVRRHFIIAVIGSQIFRRRRDFELRIVGGRVYDSVSCLVDMYLILGHFRDGLNREQEVPIADLLSASVPSRSKTMSAFVLWPASIALILTIAQECRTECPCIRRATVARCRESRYQWNNAAARLLCPPHGRVRSNRADAGFGACRCQLISFPMSVCTL